VHDAVRSLFMADQTMTIMGGAGELVASEDVDSSTLRSLRTWFEPISPEGHLVMADPVVNEWNQRRRRSGLQVYTRDLIDRVIENRVRESPYVNEALIPNRIQFWQGVYGKGVAGSEAILWVSYNRPESRVFGEGTVDVLSVLAPAFQAGLEALTRLETARGALHDLAHPLLVFDLSGREIHRSPALGRILTSQAAAPVIARARSMAREFAGALPTGAPSAGPPSCSVAPVRAGDEEYLLRVTLLPEALFSSGPALAVLILPRKPAVLPDPATLQARHGLTPREADVALLLATGATRDRIARELGISPHTARAHTEKVFLKLGVSTRGPWPPPSWAARFRTALRGMLPAPLALELPVLPLLLIPVSSLDAPVP
jgi:DNA-binding CsgD family transcriptional regulator